MGELMETYLDRLTGDHVFDTFGLQFPFQIRRIHVKGRMPLRVSPDDEIARDRYDHLGKEKLWYVVSADKGSRLLIGFRRDTDASELYQECLEGNPVKLLNTLEPRAGQFFYIPAGTPHCAFGPMTIVEVSESSALDFCLCGWGNDMGDEFDETLNIIDALDFIKYDQYPELLLSGNAGGKAVLSASQSDPFRENREGTERNGACSNFRGDAEETEGYATRPASASVPGVETLLQLNQFTVNRVELKQALSIDNTASETCLAYTSIKGSFEIQTTLEVSPDSERLLTATEGETVLIPAETTSFILAPRSADATLLEVMVEKLPADDYPLDPAGNGGENLVGDGAEPLG